MAAPSKQATSAKTALIYVTLGSLTVVWTIVYYIYLNRHEGASDTSYLICYGLFATGCTLFLIGLAVGRLGQSAMKAEVAPTPDGVVPVAAPTATAAPAVAAPPVAPTVPTATVAPPVTLPRAAVTPNVH